MSLFTGQIIEESLKDNRVLNDFEIVSLKITDEQDSSNRWHIYTVKASKEQIVALSRKLNESRWYTHFWNNEEVIVVFENKVFQYNRSEFEHKKQEVVHYGIKLGIPIEQLDFPI